MTDYGFTPRRASRSEEDYLIDGHDAGEPAPFATPALFAFALLFLCVL